MGESSPVRSRWFRVALMLAAVLAVAPAAARAAPTHLYVSNYESAGAITPFTIGGGGLLDRRARKLTGHGEAVVSRHDA